MISRSARPLAALTLSLVLCFASAAIAVAQGAPSSPATPRAAHERLAAFEGTWTRVETPPGRTFRETCEWLAGGRRHMVCRQRTESPSGATEQMIIYSYRGSDSTYTVTVLLAGGQLWRYAGRLEGERWVFNRISDRPDSVRRLRQTVTATRDTLHFTEELSENGGPWRLTDPSEAYRHVRLRLGGERRSQ
jgi:hypothetical protein